MQDGAIVIKAELDSSDLDKGLKQTESKVTNSANNLSKIVKGVGFSALLASAGKLAVDTAKKINAETEKVMATLKGASTLYQGVAVDQERLVQGLSSIAVQTGESLENLGQSVYDALSAGVKPTEDMGNVLSVVEKSAKLASAGFTDVSTALSATLKVVNAYGMGIEEVDRVQGILMQTQNSGITTVDELGAALAQVVPTASSFGLKFEDVGASLAEMTKQGTKTAQATTSLNAIISELGKNGTNASKNLKKAAESAGLSSTSFQDLLAEGKSLGEILDVMSQYAEQNGLSMVDMFSSIEAGKGALQLSGSNLQDYSSILDSMSNSAGLVSEAFDKTVDPSKKLESAWQTLAVTLGTKFKPSADNVRTILADTILKMSGQYSASSNLKGEIEKLETASKNLATAQEEVGDNMTDANKAMLAQSRLRVLEGLDEVAKTYKEASKEVTALDASLKANSSNLEFQTSRVQEYADKAGKSFEEYVADVDKYTKDHPYLTALKEEDWQNAVRMWHEAQQAVLKETAEWETKTNELADSINYLGKAVLSGSINLQEIQGFNSDLARSVEDVIPKLKEEADAVNTVLTGGSDGGNDGGQQTVLEEEVDLLKEFADATEKLTIKYQGLDDAQKETNKSFYTQEEKLQEMLELYIDFAGKGLKPTEEAMKDYWDEIVKIETETTSESAILRDLLAQQLAIETEYSNLATSGSEVGVSLASQSKKLSELESLYASFIQKGISPANGAMESLAKKIIELRAEINKQKTDSEELAETFSNLEAEYKALSDAGELNNKALYDQDAEIKALTNLYTEFARKGLSTADTTMVKIKQRLDELTNGAKDAKLSWKDLGKEMKDTLEGSLKSFTSGLSQAIVAGLESWITKDEQILELEKEISDERERLADYTLDLEDAEEDLARAQARGNDREIRDAQKKVDGLKKQKEASEDIIKAKEADKKATEDGSTAWKTFGKSAVEALAQALDGIGAQLAGLAVVHGLALDGVGAAAALAGSVAAFGAAEGLRAWAGKFAQGGIVRGDSYTGDRMIASVNAGELILNAAQQETLARVLEASVSLAQIHSAGGGMGGITVNLEGSSIYGLDEPAVGRAIYDNIQKLKYEGVI